LLILVTLGFYSQWSGNAIISYYLTEVLNQVGITDQKTQLEINGGLGIWGWIIAVTSSLYCDKVGRRKLFLISTFCMMIVYVFTLWFSAHLDFNDRLCGPLRGDTGEGGR
jgi:MFS-type transporter involved in bile tolerance (Atg22 family)